MKTGPWTVVREVKAWDAVGHDGTLRIKGGTAIYDAVDHFCDRQRTNRVRLARLGEYEGTNAFGIHQTNRWVEPDTILEILQATPKTT